MCNNITTLKLQYKNYETGEFTEEKSVDKESLLSIFDQNTEIVHLRRTYTIKEPLISFYIKAGESYLRIMHFAKDAFTIWYCNEYETVLFKGYFYKKSTRKIIGLFIDNKIEELYELIPKKKN